MSIRVKSTQVADLPRGEALAAHVALARMQTEKHAVGQFLAKACRDTKNEQLYHKAVSRIGLVNAYVLLSKIKDPLSNIQQPARWFMWSAKSMKNVDNK